ncbi:hypothetical protein B5X24_HaOG211069 [Helicoverpa armigera]|uniref:Reverse transcriptase domain-containing protein n=1 Tax=Helicoverpa armigera TaxID=29058 RepID=A0A2W1BH45_HELAM|nr:hypothetical protein B5X24_HaOG211069 [Helicoverpa armigera]
MRILEQKCNTVPNCNDRQLDLVLSARSGVTVSAADEGLQPVDAYHPPLAVSVEIAASSRRLPAAPAMLAPAVSPGTQRDYPITRKQWNFHKANFNHLYYLISNIDWSDIYCLNDPDEVLKLFYEKIYEAFDVCVPLKRPNLNGMRYIYPVWYTPEIIREIKYKHQLHKNYKASKLRSDYDLFARSRAIVKAETALAHDRYCDRVQSHLTKEPRAFWGYLRSRKSNSSKQKLIKEGRILSDSESAREFAQFFHSVYNPEPAALSASAASAAPGPPPGARVHLAPLHRADVHSALARLPPKRSAGPDGIPAFIFRDCRDVLGKPLLHLYNVCIATATFPDKWKLTRVVPVPKGSGGSEPSNSRPVAILCTPAKVFEAAIHKQLYVQVLLALYIFVVSVIIMEEGKIAEMLLGR